MTSKETAAEQILAKHLGWDTFSGGSVMCNTSEILAAMEEYGASLQPKEADKDREIERLKAMQQKFEDELPMAEDWNQELLLRGRIKSLRTVIGLLQGDKQLTDKDIQSKWISVSDSLPEELEYVTCLNTEGCISTGRLYSNGFIMFFADGEKPVGELAVTHWQPLPPLPNSSTGDERSVANTPNSSNDADNQNTQPTPKDEDVEKMAEAILMKYWNADDLEDLQMSITLNPQVQFFILAMIEMYNAAKTTK
jgi:hypothetical protein